MFRADGGRSELLRDVANGRRLGRSREELSKPRTDRFRTPSHLQTKAENKNVTLVNERPELTATGDVNRLDQVLTNLVDNAIKYGLAGGTVTAGGNALADGARGIFVRDDGPGIPAEAIDRVFGRFYRGDKVRSRDQGGTGSGLSIVKHIVQAHGGEVRCESELGRGATFFFTLPAV